MSAAYSVEQTRLGASDCERLCRKPLRELELLAHRAGWTPISSPHLSVTVATALNMLALSDAADRGIELKFMGDHLPGLRNEGLLNLSGIIENWSFVGSQDSEKEFWPLFYGDTEIVRSRVCRLVGASTVNLIWQLRYHSPSDIERISPYEGSVPSGRIPRLIINAHNLAARVSSVVTGPLFTARPITLA